MNPHRLKEADDCSSLVGVGIMRNDRPPFNTHVGVVYRHEVGTLFFLHQAWHKVTRNEPWTRRVFVVPNMPPERARFFPLICKRVGSAADGGGSIPYALRYPRNPSLNLDTGEIVADDNGLNCSTFVIFLFRNYGFDLIDLADWPLRAEDREWHQRLVDMIRHRDPEQAAKVEAEIGCQRVRPEEVTGAGLFENTPVGYEQAAQGGVRVLEVLDAQR